MKNILILGIGNLILRDEGIGIHVVKKLEETEVFPPGVDIIDGATGGYFLLNDIVEYRHVVLIDASLDTLDPGTVRVIKPHYSSDYPTLLSAHEFGLKNMIDAMIFLEKMPDMYLIVISVEDAQQLGLDLSPAVEASIPKVILTVKEIVKQLISINKNERISFSTYEMGKRSS